MDVKSKITLTFENNLKKKIKGLCRILFEFYDNFLFFFK
jgi:hypothetical protein